MPIYEYRCTSCGHEFSKLEKMTSESQGVECPSPEGQIGLQQRDTASGEDSEYQGAGEAYVRVR